MKETEIPNDADGDAMRRVFSRGSDPSRPMKVDFQIAAPDKETAQKIAAVVKPHGFEVDCYEDGEEGGFTCSCSRLMLLVHRDLLRIQEELDQLSAPLGGKADGWGTFGNKEEPN